MAEVTINGKKLHEINMRLKGDGGPGVSYLIYPEHRINVKLESENLILQVPPSLAVALFHTIFHTGREVSVGLGNKALGNFRLKDVYYNNSPCGLIDICLDAAK